MIRETLHTFTTVEKTVVDIRALIETRPQAFWIAEAEAELAGFMTFGPFRAGPGYAHTVEHSILIAAPLQGQGIGARLMRAGEHAACAQGVRVMIAAISGANPGAVSFHAKLGYSHSGHLGEVGFKAGQWLDLIFMQKNLAKDR